MGDGVGGVGGGEDANHEHNKIFDELLLNTVVRTCIL